MLVCNVQMKNRRHLQSISQGMFMSIPPSIKQRIFIVLCNSQKMYILLQPMECNCYKYIFPTRYKHTILHMTTRSYAP